MHALIEHSPGCIEVCKVICESPSGHYLLCIDMQGNLHVVEAHAVCDAANDAVYSQVGDV